MAKQKKTMDPLRGFHPGGSFEYEGKTVILLINGKSGQLMFEMEGKIVEDPALQNALMSAFQIRNQRPPEKS
ncbi:hypothetical protein IM774_02420 [Erysipelotrichaceae bacterium RD49]|nr:hypothetical protein [Erysipelotrichaceae bacterium RD49]